MKRIILSFASLLLGVLLIGISMSIHGTSEFALPILALGFLCAVGGASGLLLMLFVSTK